MQFKNIKRVAKWIPTGKDYPKLKCIWVDVEEEPQNVEIVSETEQLEFSEECRNTKLGAKADVQKLVFG